MRILFIGGMYRGYRLAQRLIARGEEIVGAYVYEEDAHESPKYCDELAAMLAAHTKHVQKTRKITGDQLPGIRDRLEPDVIFCLGWRTLIPTEILACAPRGGIAVHDSLLPRLRGFAPTNWGLVLGHDKLGATLFQLTDSVDAGEIYFQEAISPGTEESYESIQMRIADVAAGLFDQYLDAEATGTISGRKQNDAAATFACARSPSDGEIDWRQSSVQIARLVRALGPPAPGAFTYCRGTQLYVLDARHVEQPHAFEGRIPGRVVDRNLSAGTADVLCGDGVLRIREVREANGHTTSAASLLRSVRESLGLNYSQEIIQLRDRLARLESLLQPNHLTIEAA